MAHPADHVPPDASDTRGEVTVQVIANDLETREMVAAFISDDPQLALVANNSIATALESCMRLNPRVIMAHAASDRERTELLSLASAWPDSYFLLTTTSVGGIPQKPENVNLIARASADDLVVVLQKLVHVIAEAARPTAEPTISSLDSELLAALTVREIEVLRLTAEGLSIKEIATNLHRSFATVAKHRDNLMKKTHLHDKVSLTRFAIRTGVSSA